MCTPEQLDGEKWSFVSLPSRSVRSPRLLVSAHDYRDEVLRKGVGLLAWADSKKKEKEKRRDTTAEPLRNRGATHTHTQAQTSTNKETCHWEHAQSICRQNHGTTFLSRLPTPLSLSSPLCSAKPGCATLLVKALGKPVEPGFAT